ncbi:PREDICTED: transcription factor DIVARICATA-like [Camelina sativa]|uniref:Transcription factor DIVARICATA-like n=1 Tax=Camelina sativa TaxID=90675 RepID=A0ABM0XRB8_CAMSA|nr:PREDICTED: transcription factor DIVARICATA-like [Camelina sativa]
MAENSWTREENEKFKNALEVFSAFLPTRFEKIAECLQKPVPDVKKHYEEMVNDLLRGIAFPNELNEAQSSYEAERTKWSKETHEWFLIGLKRYGKDWCKIAILLDTKNPMQVAMYARKYFNWQNSEKNVIDSPGANDIPDLRNTKIVNDVRKRRRHNNITLVDNNVDSTDDRQEIISGWIEQVWERRMEDDIKRICQDKEPNASGQPMLRSITKGSNWGASQILESITLRNDDDHPPSRGSCLGP